MEEGTGWQDSPEGREVTGTQASKETEPSAALPSAERRSGPTWRGWVFSILAAILLSVAATLLLGGYGTFRPDRAALSGAAGTGSSCCPPAERNP